MLCKQKFFYNYSWLTKKNICKFRHVILTIFSMFFYWLCLLTLTEAQNSWICNQPRAKGPGGRGSLQRFYYNPLSQNCELFIYGGCQGTQNNFNTLRECEQTCERSRPPQPQPPTPSPPPQVDSCDQPKVVGPCRGSLKRFYYNSLTNRCETFFYGGCQRNQNNFQTQRQCERTCERSMPPLPPSRPDEACFQPKVVGPCRAAVTRFYYNADMRSCEPFIYGGCKGNQNNFESSRECERTCLQSGPGFDLCDTIFCGECRRCVPRKIQCMTPPCRQYECSEIPNYCPRCTKCSANGQCTKIPNCNSDGADHCQCSRYQPCPRCYRCSRNRICQRIRDCGRPPISPGGTSPSSPARTPPISPGGGRTPISPGGRPPLGTGRRPPISPGDRPRSTPDGRNQNRPSGSPITRAGGRP